MAIDCRPTVDLALPAFLITFSSSTISGKSINSTVLKLEAKARDVLAQGIGIGKVARTIGLGVGTVARIKAGPVIMILRGGRIKRSN